MTQTLPTVIGMGVVSRTTDTMFGRQHSRSTQKSTAKPARRKYYYRKVGSKRVRCKMPKKSRK